MSLHQGAYFYFLSLTSLINYKDTLSLHAEPNLQTTFSLHDTHSQLTLGQHGIHTHFRKRGVTVLTEVDSSIRLVTSVMSYGSTDPYTVKKIK